MGRCYIFLSIFLAQLIALSAHDGKSGTCKHKGAQVLRTAEDVDWTSVVMPFFSSFGFAGGNRRVGCNCQLTTPNPREICPTNATMNVTSGKHSWWDGLGMRRFRTRRHAHFSSGRKFRKSISLKDGCPVRVPLQPCPKKLQQCPEKLQRGRRSPHKGGRGRGGGGRSGGRWDDSSEEQGAQRSRNGKYYYRVTIKEKGDSGQLRCTDPTTKQTKVLCNQGGTTSYSTVMLTSTVYSYGTREDEEDDNGNGEQGDDYQLQDPIDTSPISGSRTEFTISPTRSRRPYEPTIMLTEELEFPGTSMVKSTPSVSIEQSESTRYAFSESARFNWPAASEVSSSTLWPADTLSFQGVDSYSYNQRSTWSSNGGASKSYTFSQQTDQAYSSLYSMSSAEVTSEPKKEDQVRQSSTTRAPAETTSYYRWGASSTWAADTQVNDQSTINYPLETSIKTSTQRTRTEQTTIASTSVKSTSAAQTKSPDVTSTTTVTFSTTTTTTTTAIPETSTAQYTRRRYTTENAEKQEDAASASTIISTNKPLIAESTTSIAREIPLANATPLKMVSSTVAPTSQKTTMLPSSSSTAPASPTKNDRWKVDITDSTNAPTTTATTKTTAMTARVDSQTTTATAAQISSPSRSPGFGLMDLTKEKDENYDSSSNLSPITRVGVTTEQTTSLRSTKVPQATGKYTHAKITSGPEALMSPDGKTSPTSERNNFGEGRRDTWARSESSTLSTSSSVETTLPLKPSVKESTLSTDQMGKNQGASTSLNLLDIVNSGRVDEKNGRTGQSSISELLTTSRSVDLSSGKEITYNKNATHGNEIESNSEKSTSGKNSTSQVVDHQDDHDRGDIKNYLLMLLVGGNNNNCNCSDRNSNNHTDTGNGENRRTAQSLNNAQSGGENSIFYIGFPILGSFISQPIVKENKSDCAICPNLNFTKVMKTVQSGDCLSSMFGALFK